MSEANKAVARRYNAEIVNQGNLALIDELFSADSIYRGPNFPELRGREARKQYFASLRSAVPDLHVTLDELIAEGDKVVLRWSLTGTHRGEFQGIASTGKKVSISGISILCLTSGMITDEFQEWDSLGYMQQLGVAPALVQVAGAGQ